jgi:hypothetical protein
MLQTTIPYGIQQVGVNTDWRASAYLGVPLCAAELRLRAGVDRPVRTGRVAFADGSLTMIMLSASLAGCARWHTVGAGTLVSVIGGLWVMRRAEPVPSPLSGSAATHLARTGRPGRPILSSLPHRCPWGPYYRFYYGRVVIIAGNGTRVLSHGDDLAHWEPRVASRQASAARPRGAPGQPSTQSVPRLWAALRPGCRVVALGGS